MQGMYSAKDIVSKLWSDCPFTFENDDSARRAFFDAVKGPEAKQSFKGHPEDYQLYKLGEYDPREGKMTALKEPELVAKAIEVMSVTGGKHVSEIEE